ARAPPGLPARRWGAGRRAPRRWRARSARAIGRTVTPSFLCLMASGMGMQAEIAPTPQAPCPVRDGCFREPGAKGRGYYPGRGRLQEPFRPWPGARFVEFLGSRWGPKEKTMTSLRRGALVLALGAGIVAGCESPVEAPGDDLAPPLLA